MNFVSYLDSKDAAAVDAHLMGELKYSDFQLMELAGLSVAQSFCDYNSSLEREGPQRILTICGPGNNGGDALVAARHLALFGHKLVIFYPKKPAKELFNKLVAQCENIDIEFIDALPEDLNKDTYDYILDGIFGYSFEGEIRSPFDVIIDTIGKSGIPIVSIDIPSGWHVDEGNINNTFTPDVLISLTVPKNCALQFNGVHYCGGRFVPLSTVEKFGLVLPEYEGFDQFIKL